MVYCNCKGGQLPIWIPYKKVRQFLIKKIREDEGCDERTATRLLDRIGQTEYEKVLYIEIRKKFSGYIKAEIKEWAVYEKSLEKKKNADNV